MKNFHHFGKDYIIYINYKVNLINEKEEIIISVTNSYYCLYIFLAWIFIGTPFIIIFNSQEMGVVYIHI